MKRQLSTSLALAMLTVASAFGSGLLIPKDESLPPLAIKHQRVDIQIKDGVVPDPSIRRVIREMGWEIEVLN